MSVEFFFWRGRRGLVTTAIQCEEHTPWYLVLLCMSLKEHNKTLVSSGQYWILTSQKSNIFFPRKQQEVDLDICSSYLTVVWWWRSHTRGSPHPRCYRPWVWSHSASWGLRAREREKGKGRVQWERQEEQDKLMQPSNQTKTLETLNS